MNKLPLGLEGVEAYLKENFQISSSDIAITQFKGGYSNLTYRIQSPAINLVLRRPPLGLKIAKAHDMLREYSILQALTKAGYNKIPRPIAACEDDSIIGAPFFIMEEVTGPILRNRIPTETTESTTFFAQLSKHSIDCLVQLHQLELHKSGLIHLGKPDGYVARQVRGWVERYFSSETNELPAMNAVADWLNKNIPKEEEVAFIHNDFKYDNLILSSFENPEIKAVLDWEMATVGDPLMDLGTSLAYWAEDGDEDILKLFNISHAAGNMSRQEVVAYYFEKKNQNPVDMVFYYAFGLFKVGVIAQQIYKRYTLGFAQDERFAGLIHVVKAAGNKALNSIQKDTI
jgi:aminoglycoside phosphotransferase (APT) family kinase protein